MVQELQVVKDYINQGEFQKADIQLQAYIDSGAVYDDMVAILDGSIGAALSERERQWQAIRAGLAYNCKNYELYVMLGYYYLDINLQQAYLCFENALLYCNVPEDREQIVEMIFQLEDEYGVTVPKCAIVVLSYNLLAFTKLCIESIRTSTSPSSREIIVVDNASEDGSVEWLQEQKDIKLIQNSENKGFPTACNQGIARAEKESDIFLLNNDTVLPENALFWLRMGLYENETVGATGSVSNYVANGQMVEREWKDVAEALSFAKKNNIPEEYPYEEKMYLIGFALLIKRSVLDKVGVLDERFSPGNSEDVDYGLRVLKEGYKNILCKNSFILHFGSKSFEKLGGKFGEILNRNQELLERKWKMQLKYYMAPRMDLINLIKEKREKDLHVLEIGCGCGATMAKIKSLYPFSDVQGVELIPEAAEIAGGVAPVICGNVETLEFPYPEKYFDYCIMGDVLEHLHEPECVLKRLHKHMKRGGHIILSMPNVKHWSVILPLLKKDEFTYTDWGILDRTHLKMYTGKEIEKLVTQSGYEVEGIEGREFGELREDDERLLRELAKLMGVSDINSYMVFQYIFSARAI